MRAESTSVPKSWSWTVQTSLKCLQHFFPSSRISKNWFSERTLSKLCELALSEIWAASSRSRSKTQRSIMSIAADFLICQTWKSKRESIFIFVLLKFKSKLQGVQISGLHGQWSFQAVSWGPITGYFHAFICSKGEIIFRHNWDLLALPRSKLWARGQWNCGFALLVLQRLDISWTLWRSRF